MTQSEPVLEFRAAQPYVGVVRRVTMATMVPTLPDAASTVSGWLAEHGRAPTGSPFWRYRLVDMPRALEVEVGFPVDDAGPTDAGSDVQAGVLPAGRYATITHVGHPDELEQVTGRLLAWAAQHGFRWDMSAEPDGEHWAARLEIYLTDPAAEPDMAAWRTQLAFKLAD